MAKKKQDKTITVENATKENQLQEVALLPSESDIKQENKVNVSKVEMANILIIQVQEELNQELAQANKVLSKLEADRYSKYHQELSKAIEDAKKKITYKEFNKDKADITHRTTNLCQQSHMLTQDMRDAIDRGVTIQFNIDIRSEYRNEGVSLSIKVAHNAYCESIIEVDKKIKQCKEVIKDIETRIAKAGNGKYVQAQLNMGLLGSTKGGAALVANIKDMAANLSKGIFAKSPDVPALPE